MDYDSILVPTDGSDRAAVALDHAIGVANRCESTIHILHVVQLDAATERLDDDTLRERIEHAGEEAVETLVERASEGGHKAVQSAVVRGRPAEEIREYATDHDIELIVMATAGRTGDAREMIGSVTESVVRTADVPVLTVRDP